MSCKRCGMQMEKEWRICPFCGQLPGTPRDSKAPMKVKDLPTELANLEVRKVFNLIVKVAIWAALGFGALVLLAILSKQ
jgi:hypothetical protein